jgi:hypothetical protein
MPRSPSLRHASFLAALSVLAVTAGCAPEAQETDGPEPIGEAAQAQTVAEAANTTCSTTSVKGLSLQIIAQGQCITPGAFVQIPDAPNLTLGAAVFPFLEEPAKDALVATLESKPGTTMTINSMLRTVAQQYLLYQWSLSDICGVTLAATPGNSNHETGIALDVQNYGEWMNALENHGFVWFGNSDAVHFDYQGPGAVSHKGLDILAFQQLWNKNNPGDLIDEDGAYGPQTASRLQQSPAEGFPLGASCDPTPAQGPDIHPSIALVSEQDRFGDHSSAGVLDLFEGETYAVTLEIVNKGGASTSNVDVGVWIEEPFLVATDYLIESDWMNGGMFKENDANTDPANPPHGQPLGGSFFLKMNGLSPDETKRITLTAVAKGYSIGLADAPDVRFWVKDVPDHYHQDAFDGASTNTNDSQTFGEKLQVYLPTDIYSRTRWEWDTDRLEGWTPLGMATIAADPETNVLMLGGEGDNPGMLGPDTSFPAAEHPAIDLRARRTGGTGRARLYFATADDPAMNEDKVIDFDLPDDEGFHELTLAAGDHPRWSGTIVALRLDPFAGPGTLEIDYVRALSAGGGPGGNAGDGNGIEDEAGSSCTCTAPGAGTPVRVPSGLLGAVLVSLIALGRRPRTLRGLARRPL